jgi:cation diffusion facilitator family transporter
MDKSHNQMDSVRYQKDQANLRFQKIALVVSVVLFTLKVIAYYVTNSNAILTDALEGLVNILGSAVGVFSLYYATLPRDRNHPYGHGKIEFLSSGFEGGLILIAGGSMILKAIYSFFYPENVDVNWLGMSLIAIAGVINYILGFSMVRQGESVNSVQLQAGGKHLISDGYSTLGLIIGLGIVWATGYEFLDNVLAAALGAIILFTGYKIIRQSISGIMDEADEEQIGKVAKVLQDKRRPSWVDIHNFRIVRYGAKLHMDAHLTLPWYYTLKASHDEVDKLELVLADAFQNDVEASIHTEPCVPRSCEICALKNCKERIGAFVKHVTWDSDHILDDEHHSTFE